MRKTLIALMLATALPTMAMAMGDDPAGGPRPGQGPAHFGMEHGMHEHGMHRGPFGDLDLNKEQRQQIDHLMRQQMQGRRELAKKYLAKLPAAEQKAMHDEMQASEKKTQGDIRAVLTPDQQKQFDEGVKKREQRHAEWQEFEAWKAAKAKKAQ